MTDKYRTWAGRWRIPLGFAFAVAYLIVSQPTRRLLIFGGIVALAGLVVRAFAAGYIEKSQSLATAGPFAWTRNPLYLGSFMLGTGFMIAGASWIMAMVFAVLFILVYLPVMRNEEGFLRSKFGSSFEAYASNVPLFLPAPGRRWRGTGRFQWSRYRKNREYNAAIGYGAMIVFLTVKLVLR